MISSEALNTDHILDFTPGNILHRVTGLNGLTEDEVLKILGSPDLNPVLNASQEPHGGNTAPDYLVYPVKWCDVDSQFISTDPCIIDFGESFEISHPPDDLGTPGSYRSPELILDKKAGRGSDIWALGCTLFEIRTGRKLFSPFDDEDDDYLVEITQLLGRLPEPWWSTTWADRKRIYRDKLDERGLVVDTLEPAPKKIVPGVKVTIHPSVADGARSLEDKIAPGVWYMSDPGRTTGRHRDIAQTEQKVLADLLRQLLNYKVEDRISAEDATDHAWFRL